LAVVLLGAGALWAVYRSLLPADLPARPAPTLPPLVRGAVPLLLGPDARGAFARVHLDRLDDGGRLPRDGYQKRRFRVRALRQWLAIHFTDDEVAEAWAAAVPMGGDRVGLAAGARALFGKTLAQLAPHEVAVLMAAAYAPLEHDPACHPDETRAARDVFLSRMAAKGLFPPGSVAAQQAMPVRVVEPCSTPSGS
jgi:hypothetical protein